MTKALDISVALIQNQEHDYNSLFMLDWSEPKTGHQTIIEPEGKKNGQA